MSPKLRAVCEKLARQPLKDVLGLLLHYECVGEEDPWRYCCEAQPMDGAPHAPNCPLDALLKSIGLPDQESREAMRDELGV